MLEWCSDQIFCYSLCDFLKLLFHYSQFLSCGDDEGWSSAHYRLQDSHHQDQGAIPRLLWGTHLCQQDRGIRSVCGSGGFKTIN